MLIVLPNMSFGGSVKPMWLPSDLDIFFSPSRPSSSGTVMQISGCWPAWIWYGRLISKLKS